MLAGIIIDGGKGGKNGQVEFGELKVKIKVNRGDEQDFAGCEQVQRGSLELQ